VPEDEVLKLIGDVRPELLVMFGTLPSAVPAVRKLIDYLREVNSCPEMQVMCCGGIYKRAEGLAEEIGADLYAPDAAEAVQVANANPTRKATVDQQTVGRTRRIRKAQARKARPRSTPTRRNAEPRRTARLPTKHDSPFLLQGIDVDRPWQGCQGRPSFVAWARSSLDRIHDRQHVRDQPRRPDQRDQQKHELPQREYDRRNPRLARFLLAGRRIIELSRSLPRRHG
jgi:hypothetical protein